MGSAFSSKSLKYKRGVNLGDEGFTKKNGGHPKTFNVKFVRFSEDVVDVGSQYYQYWY